MGREIDVRFDLVLGGLGSLRLDFSIGFSFISDAPSGEKHRADRL